MADAQLRHTVLVAILLPYATCLDRPTMNVSSIGALPTHELHVLVRSVAPHLDSLFDFDAIGAEVCRLFGALLSASMPDCLSIHAPIDVGLVYSRQ